MTKQEIRKLNNIELIKKLSNTMTVKQISKEINLSKGYIRTLCREYNIKPVRVELIPITQLEHEVIIGSILGDGSISKNGRWKNSRLVIKHSAKQVEYIKYKYNLLKRICPSEPKYAIRKEGREIFNKKDSHTLTISTMNNPTLNIYRDSWYTQEGVKILNKEEFNNITPLSLAIWIMDDGTKDNNCGGISIATMNFNLSEVKYMAEILNKKYNLICKIREKSKILYISSKSRMTLINLIEPYIIDSMEYKISLK